MNAKKIVLPKPTVRELLDQITPFVMDNDHEREFAARFELRRRIANRIVDLAKKGQLNASALLALIGENGETLNVLISLLGISQEEFYRHVTLARIEELELKGQNSDGFHEWKMERIVRELLSDQAFANLLFELVLNGKKNTHLATRVPDFLVQKLDAARLATIGDGGIDTLMRIGLKGAYDALKGNPVVSEVKKVLTRVGVRHLIGEITVPGLSRKMDCIVPDEIHDPHVLIEVGVFATTARELSEKGLVERQLREECARKYPDAVMVRVLDGVGWIARGGNALANVVEASHYVFTQKTLKGLAKVIEAHVPAKYFRR